VVSVFRAAKRSSRIITDPSTAPTNTTPMYSPRLPVTNCISPHQPAGPNCVFFFVAISSDNYERGQQTAFVRLGYSSLAVSARMDCYEQEFHSCFQILFKDLMWKSYLSVYGFSYMALEPL
jgi:hypothetical protein